MSKRQKTALVVDDEFDDLEALRAPLAANGFDVFPAKDGKSARALFNANPDAIDVVVSDVAMSPMSGTD